MSWVSSGIRYAGNQNGSSRIADTNVAASPAPTRIRAVNANGNEGEKASSNCPQAISRAPRVIIVRGPIRSSARPTGIWLPA